MTATAAKIPPAVIATATAYSVQLANAQKFAPELAVIEANPALFTKLQADPTNKTLQAQVVAAAGGGAKGLGVLTTIAANSAAIDGVIAVGPQLATVAPYAADLKVIAPYSTQLTTIAPYSSELTAIAPYSAQLTALSKVPPAAIAYLTAHGAAVQNGRRHDRRPVEDLVLDLLRRDHRLPALHPAAARALADQGRQAGRGSARGHGRGRNGQAQRLSSPAERAPRALSRPLSSPTNRRTRSPAQPPLAPGTVSGLFMRTMR